MVKSRWVVQPRQPIRRNRNRRRRGLGNYGPNGRRATIPSSNHGPNAHPSPVVQNDTLSRINRYYVENRDRLISRFFPRRAVQPAVQPSESVGESSAPAVEQPRNDGEPTAPAVQPPQNDGEPTAPAVQPPRNDGESTRRGTVAPIGIAVKPEQNPLLWTWKESSVVLIRTEIPDDVWERAKLRYGDLLGDRPPSTSSQSPSTSSQSPPTPRDRD